MSAFFDRERAGEFSSLAPKICAVLGVALCFVMSYTKISGNQSFCFSNGCSLFSDFSIFGISLWSFGILGYLVPALFSNPFFARFILICDSVFLAIMQFGEPCINCMFAGILFFIIFAFRIPRPLLKKDKVIAFSWIFLFALNLGSFFSELGDYAITEPSLTRIYFSPSCIACENALSEYPQATLYPVSENKNDLPVIWSMVNLIKEGKSPVEALVLAKTNPSENIPLWLEWRLWKNKGKVLEYGGLVPLIIKNGFPNKKHNYIRDFYFKQ